MGCSGRDKDIVMTRGNKGIRARGRTIVEHAAVINALQCGGVLAPNPCLALALDIQYKKTKYKVQNTKHKIQNSKCKIRNTENYKKCGGVLPLNPCLALALAGQALLAPQEVLCSTLACDIPSNHSSCNTTPEINTSFIENHQEENMQVFV